jgi:hypothetical protein
MKYFIASKKISALLFMLLLFLSQVAWATEPICHLPGPNGICYYDIYGHSGETCGIDDKINISGVVTQIHTKDILPYGYPVEKHYQHYWLSDNTDSRFRNSSNVQDTDQPYTPDQFDSIYAKVIQIKHFNKWEVENPKYDSASSDMMQAVDSNFILVPWSTAMNAGDSIVVLGYTAYLNLMCSNTMGYGDYEGEITIYPASTSSLSVQQNSNEQSKEPSQFFTINGKIQQQKPAFVPVVEVFE